MKDIKVIGIKDVLLVNRVAFLPNVLPPSLSISGAKLLRADEVYINDIPSPEFMKVSNTNILAQIPSSQVTSPIRSVTVLATRPYPDQKSFLHMEMSTFASTEGLQRLVQHFVKLLLQTPGSDRFNPSEGGGLLSLVGTVVTRGHTGALASSVASAVTRTRDQIITKQGRVPRLPPDEKLLRADTLATGFNPGTTSLAARIAIGAISGREAVANLTF